MASKELRTTGVPAKIKLVADRTELRNDRNDLSYVKVEITDAEGDFVPNADIPVTFTVTGVGQIAGSGNACPNDMKSYNNSISAFKRLLRIYSENRWIHEVYFYLGNSYENLSQFDKAKMYYSKIKLSQTTPAPTRLMHLLGN